MKIIEKFPVMRKCVVSFVKLTVMGNHFNSVAAVVTNARKYPKASSPANRTRNMQIESLCFSNYSLTARWFERLIWFGKGCDAVRCLFRLMLIAIVAAIPNECQSQTKPNRMNIEWDFGCVCSPAISLLFRLIFDGGIAKATANKRTRILKWNLF